MSYVVQQITGGGSSSTGDFELLATYTPSGAASVNLTSVITSTHFSYEIHFDLTVATDSVSLRLRTSTNNGSAFDSAAGDYLYANTEYETVGTDSAGTSASPTSETSIAVAGGTTAIGNAAGEGVSGVIELINPLGTTGRRLISWASVWAGTGGDPCTASGTGFRNNSADIDAAQILASSGNISGTVKIYGKLAAG